MGPLDKTVRIGLMHPRSGSHTFAGVECIEAAHVAVRTLEEHGAIPRGRVELLEGQVDSIATAASEAKRFIVEGAQVLMGTLLSDWVPPAAEIARREGVLYWEAVAASEEITARGFPNFYRFNRNCEPYARDMVDFVADVLAPRWGAKPAELRIGIAHDPSSFSTSLATSARDAVETRGATLVAFERTPARDAPTSDLGPVIDALKAARPDVVLSPTFGTATPLLWTQSLQRGFRPRAWMGAGSWALEQHIASAGEELDGVFAAGTPHVAAMATGRLSREAGRRLIEFRRRTEKPHSYRTAVDRDLTVIAVDVLLQLVLPNARSWDFDEIRKAALAVDIPLGGTLLGYGVKLTPRGDNERTFAAIMQWQHGKLETVWPELIATAAPWPDGRPVA